MAKIVDRFEYENGPDWKREPYGMRRFKPRISRALDEFLSRALSYSPALISAISHIDRTKTNRWVVLIAKTLWARLAPEAGVALPEIDIFSAYLWPEANRTGTTLDGREYWVKIQSVSLNGPVSIRLVGGSHLNPREIQKVEIDPRAQAVFLTIQRGAEGYPTLSEFGAKTEGYGGYGLNGWEDILKAIHLYGKELIIEGENKIFGGANPLDLDLIRTIKSEIESDLHDKLNDRPPRSFTGVVQPGQPPHHLPRIDLIRALIGWEIATLAVESLKAASVSETKPGLSEDELEQLRKNLQPIEQSQTYAIARQIQSVQKGNRFVVSGLSWDTRASNRDLKEHLNDLEEALDDIDRIVQNKEIPAGLAEYITKFQAAKAALARATPEDMENFRKSLALAKAHALEQLIQTGDRKAVVERRMLADKTPGHYRVLLWDAERHLNRLRQSEYAKTKDGKEEVKREEARVKGLTEKADEQDRTLALGSTVKNLNTFVSTLDARSGGAAYKSLTGMINIDGSVMTKAAWIIKLVQAGAPLAVNFSSLSRKRYESEDDDFDGNEGDREDTTKVFPEYIIGSADDRYTLGAYGFAFAQYLGAPWIKPPENAIIFDDFAFANAKRMNKAAEQILSSPKYRGFILSAQAAGAKVSPTLLAIAAKG